MYPSLYVLQTSNNFKLASLRLIKCSFSSSCLFVATKKFTQGVVNITGVEYIQNVQILRTSEIPIL